MIIVIIGNTKSNPIRGYLNSYLSALDCSVTLLQSLHSLLVPRKPECCGEEERKLSRWISFTGGGLYTPSPIELAQVRE